MDDVAKVAKNLSHRMRALLCAVPIHHAESAVFWNGEYRAYPNAIQTARAMLSRNLLDLFFLPTAKGLAVRAHILENGK